MCGIKRVNSKSPPVTHLKKQAAINVYNKTVEMKQ